MNYYEIVKGGKTVLPLKQCSCFSNMGESHVGGEVLFHCVKHKDFGDRDKWYLKTISEFLPFSIQDETKEKFIFKVKIERRAGALAILSILRVLDHNELANTNVLFALSKAFSLKDKVEPYYAIMLGCFLGGTTTCGHDFFPPYNSYTQKRHIITKEKLVQNLNNGSKNSVYEICGGKMFPADIKFNDLVQKAPEKILEFLLEKD